MGWHGDNLTNMVAKTEWGESAGEKFNNRAGLGAAVSFFSHPDWLLPLRDAAVRRAGQLLGRFKPRSAQGPRLLRPPLRRVHTLQSDEACAQTPWARLTQPLYKKPGAGGADRARPEAPRLTVPHLAALQPSLPSGSLLCLWTVGCYFGLWGTKGS